MPRSSASRTRPSEFGVTARLRSSTTPTTAKPLSSNPLYWGYLTQCWSLAVEEQFYLIWAVLLLVALKFGYRKLGYALAIAGVAVCTANRLYIVLSAPHWNIFRRGPDVLRVRYSRRRPLSRMPPRTDCDRKPS